MDNTVSGSFSFPLYTLVTLDSFASSDIPNSVILKPDIDWCSIPCIDGPCWPVFATPQAALLFGAGMNLRLLQINDAYDFLRLTEPLVKDGMKWIAFDPLPPPSEFPSPPRCLKEIRDAVRDQFNAELRKDS